MAFAQVAQLLEKPWRRYDQAAVGLDRLNEDRGNLLRRDVAGKTFFELLKNIRACRVVFNRAIRIGIMQADQPVSLFSMLLHAVT